MLLKFNISDFKDIKIDKKWIILIVASVALVAMIVVLIMGFIALNNRNQPKPPVVVQEQEPYTKQSFVMDTIVIQQIYDKDIQKAEAAAKLVDAELNRLENKLSLYKENSEISKINNQAGMTEVNKYVPSKETYNLLKKAAEVCELSYGRFDITIAPLVKLWGITSGNENHIIPDDNKIQQALDKVNYKNMILNDSTGSVWLKKPFMAIDLGGVVKGYACDRIKQIYEKNNITSALISVGGNIVSVGKKPDGSDFKIGLRDPFGDANDIFAKIVAPGKKISTTGPYERYFIKDDVRYHHVLDTLTGYPVESDLESVSIISDDGTLGDCMSTTLFIEGTEGIIEQLDNPEFSIIAVDKYKNVYASDSIKDKVTLIHGFKWSEE